VGSTPAGLHTNLHSEGGALRGEHRGRAGNPVIKVRDIAWLRFEKPDLVRAEAFANAFGLTTVKRTTDELHLRGTNAGPVCLIVRKGPRSKFGGLAFAAHEDTDLVRLAAAHDTRIQALPEEIGGMVVRLRDPNGVPVEIVSGTDDLPALPAQQPRPIYVGHEVTRSMTVQRPPREPAAVQRLGHMVLQTAAFRRSLDWYLQNFGMLVSDFQYFEKQRSRGPVLAFIRCDNGATVSDHHSLVLTLGAEPRYVHSAYQVCDIDALAAGGEFLKAAGFIRSWGIGRHIQGSQIFDYWRDPDGFLVEHFIDSDMFDQSVAPGWSPLTASGLRQWGPPPTNDFLGTDLAAIRHEARAVFGALRDRDNEFDVRRLAGLLRVART